MKLVRFESLPELRRHADAWDDLWWRSSNAEPTLRATLLEQWLQTFAKETPFIALAVEDAGQLVAALPLVESRIGRVLRVGTLPANCWSSSGELLVDLQAPQPAAAGLLRQGLRKLQWPVIQLNDVCLDAPNWRQLKSAGAESASRVRYYQGLIDTAGDWDAYQAALSSNHRQGARRMHRRLAEEGNLELHQLRDVPPEVVRDALERAFAIEDKSWKGEAGTSVLRTPGMLDFFVAQAQQLAAWGQLELWLLTLDKKIIAFEYCYLAKGVCYSHKIGYDPEFGRFAPGRVLRWLQLERMFADPEVQLFDTMGVLCEAKAKWCTRALPVSRAFISTGGVLGRSLVGAYGHAWPRLKRLLGRQDAPAELPPLGAGGLVAPDSSTNLSETSASP